MSDQMSNNHDERVLAVVSRTLRIPAESLHDDLRRGTLEQWDSLGHVNLVSALSEEFGVPLSPERALEMHTVADVKRTMAELVD